jgi:hypothetical protein
MNIIEWNTLLPGDKIIPVQGKNRSCRVVEEKNGEIGWEDRSGRFTPRGHFNMSMWRKYDEKEDNDD